MTGNLTALEQHELWRVVAKNAATDVENLRKKRFTHVTDGKAREYANLAFPLLVALEKTEPAVLKNIADAVAGIRREEHPNFPNPDVMDEGRVVACLVAVEQLMNKQFSGTCLPQDSFVGSVWRQEGTRVCWLSAYPPGWRAPARRVSLSCAVCTGRI